MKEVKYYEAGPQEKEEALEKLREHFSQHEEVLVAAVYGGFVRRNFFRDVDAAIYTGGLAENPLSLESELCIKLSKVLRIPVDVRVVDDAPPWFKLKVLTSGIAIYEKRPGATTLLLKEAVGDLQDLATKLAMNP